MARISHVHAREILDSRGNPTVEVDVGLDDGAFGRAAVPAAPRPASTRRSSSATGTPRFGGKGVLRAVANVNGPIAEALVGLDAFDQRGVDRP